MNEPDLRVLNGGKYPDSEFFIRGRTVIKCDTCGRSAVGLSGATMPRADQQHAHARLRIRPVLVAARKHKPAAGRRLDS